MATRLPIKFCRIPTDISGQNKVHLRCLNSQGAQRVLTLHTPLIVPARIVSACGVIVEVAGTDGTRIEIQSPRELTTTPLEKDKPM